MIDKYVHFGEWHVVLPDGVSLNMNSERAADMLLGLLERVGELEAQLRKRGKKKARKRKSEEVEDGD